MRTPLTFSRAELQGTKHGTFPENTQEFEFAIKKELIHKKHLLDLQLTTLGTLARHTHVDIC